MALKMIDTSPKSSDVCHGLFLVIKKMALFMYGVFGRDQLNAGDLSIKEFRCELAK